MIAAVIHAVLLVHVFAALTVRIHLAGDAKVSGRIQDRLGPTRVGGMFGWLQSLADGIKLVQKEDLCPPAADSMLFQVGSLHVVCVSSFAAFMVLPFQSMAGWRSLRTAVCSLCSSILSLEVFGIIMAGYSSGSKVVAVRWNA